MALEVLTIEILIVLLVCASVMDCLYEKIPNSFIILGIILGITYRILLLGETNYLNILVGFMLPVILLFPVFFIRAMGAGDIKLLAVISLFIGTKGILLSTGYAIAFGAAFALLKMLVSKNLKKRFRYLFGFIKKLFAGGFIEIGNVDYIGGINEAKASAVIHFSVPIMAGVLYCVWRRMI